MKTHLYAYSYKHNRGEGGAYTRCGLLVPLDATVSDIDNEIDPVTCKNCRKLDASDKQLRRQIKEAHTKTKSALENHKPTEVPPNRSLS